MDRKRRLLELQVLRRKRRRRWLNKYKEAKGCEICGYNLNGVAMDFDHLDRAQKLFNPSSRYLNSSLKKIFAEIRKCRILCANCHRIHSFDSKHHNTKSQIHYD